METLEEEHRNRSDFSPTKDVEIKIWVWFRHELEVHFSLLGCLEPDLMDFEEVAIRIRRRSEQDFWKITHELLYFWVMLISQCTLHRTVSPPNSNQRYQSIARYQAEQMPARHSTAYVYRSFLKCHISPQWGSTPIQSIEPRPVKLWLKSLDLSPKSKTHIRSLMHLLLEFAMFDGSLAVGRNSISGPEWGATKRIRKAPTLTVEQFSRSARRIA